MKICFSSTEFNILSRAVFFGNIIFLLLRLLLILVEDICSELFNILFCSLPFNFFELNISNSLL